MKRARTSIRRVPRSSSALAAASRERQSGGSSTRPVRRKLAVRARSRARRSAGERSVRLASRRSSPRASR